MEVSNGSAKDGENAEKRVVTLAGQTNEEIRCCPSRALMKMVKADFIPGTASGRQLAIVSTAACRLLIITKGSFVVVNTKEQTSASCQKPPFGSYSIFNLHSKTLGRNI